MYRLLRLLGPLFCVCMYVAGVLMTALGSVNWVHFTGSPCSKSAKCRIVNYVGGGWLGGLIEVDGITVRWL